MSQSGSLFRGGGETDNDILAFTGGAGTAGTFPVLPNGSGQVQLSSTGGTIQITGGVNTLNFEATGSVLNVTTLTGNDSIPVPPTGNNINTIGSGNIVVTGNAGTSTLTTSLTGLVDHALVVGNGTNAFTNLPVGATNQVLLGNSGSDPSWGTVPNAGLTNSSVTINSGNNITVTGGSPLALGGTASVAVTGTSNHDVQVGNASGSLTSIANGSTGQVFQANTGNDPTWSTATYPSVATTAGTILRADGTNWLATTAQYPNTTTINQLLFSSANNFITGITASNNGVLISGATGVPSWLADGNTGQILTATAGSPPTWQDAPLPPAAVISLTGNIGGAVPTTANNINTVGTGSILISGNPVTSTLTTELTGLTNHAVLVGAGTPTIGNVGPSAITGQVLQSQGLAADPAFSTATYPSTAIGTGTILRADGTNWLATTATYPNTTTINQILYSSANNTVTGLATGNDGVLITSNTGAPSFLANGSTGQVLTATTGSPPSWQAAPGGFTPNSQMNLFDDFFSQSGPSSLGWTNNNWTTSPASGTGSNPGIYSNASLPSGQALLYLYNNANTGQITIGSSSISLNWVIKTNTLSNSTNRYTLYAGIGFGSSSGVISDGCFFEYSDNINSGNWTIVNSKASATTTANSLVAAQNSSFVNLGIVINTAGTSVKFTINGVEVAGSPLATNIPTVSISPLLFLVRGSGTIAAASVLCDLFYMSYTLPTPR